MSIESKESKLKRMHVGLAAVSKGRKTEKSPKMMMEHYCTPEY